MNALMQSLEARKLFAAVTATLVGGKLTVTGTEAVDHITIDSTYPAGKEYVGVFEGEVTDDSQPVAQFPVEQVKSVLVDARGGNDTVDLGLYVLSDGEVPVTILGGGGNDTVNDVRAGNGSQTLIDGGTGDDTLAGGDTILGGIGRDGLSINYFDGLGPTNTSPTQAHLDGGVGNDTIQALGGDTVIGGDGNDTIYNGGLVDAGAGFDTVYTYVDSIVHLGPDNDKHYIEYSAYEDVTSTLIGPTSITSYGDGGNDIIQVTDDGGPLLSNHILKVYGGADNDTLYGGRGQDSLNGESGNDKILGGDANDLINGGTDNDLLYGDNGNDDLYGSDGNDTLYGGAGNNRLFGQKGVDTLHSKNGQVDQLFATTDGDVLDRDAFDVLKA